MLFENWKVYKFTLMNGNIKTGQFDPSNTMYFSNGEPMVIAILEGATEQRTNIPWRAIESYVKL